MSSAEGLKQRKGGKKEEEKPLLDKEDKPKPVVRTMVHPHTHIEGRGVMGGGMYIAALQ